MFSTSHTIVYNIALQIFLSIVFFLLIFVHKHNASDIFKYLCLSILVPVTSSYCRVIFLMMSLCSIACDGPGHKLSRTQLTILCPRSTIRLYVRGLSSYKLGDIFLLTIAGNTPLWYPGKLNKLISFDALDSSPHILFLLKSLSSTISDILSVTSSSITLVSSFVLLIYMSVRNGGKVGTSIGCVGT